MCIPQIMRILQIMCIPQIMRIFQIMCIPQIIPKNAEGMT